MKAGNEYFIQFSTLGTDLAGNQFKADFVRQMDDQSVVWADTVRQMDDQRTV